MRAALTWETDARGRSAAALYERGALALALALPVPLLAAVGMSLPLPQSIFRLGVLAAERTALAADALPGVGHEERVEAVRPARTVGHAPAAARTPTTKRTAARVQVSVARAPVHASHRRHPQLAASAPDTTV